VTASLLTIARLELVSAARLKWIRLLTAALATLVMAAAYSAGAAQELSGADGFARTTMALIPVVLILVPLAALVLGVSGQAVDCGHEAFLFGQPVARATVLVGRWLGEAAALAGAIGLGFGLGGALIAVSTGAAGLLRFAFFVGSSLALAMIFLSIAAAIAAHTDKRATALGIGTFAWFFFVLLYDGAVLGIAGWVTGSIGGRLLFASVFGNPVDLIRVAMLSVSGTPNVLGAAGEAWMRFLGGATQAMLACGGMFVLWTAAPLALAVRALAARDL
jgi:Cu-processing system permease protein